METRLSREVVRCRPLSLSLSLSLSRGAGFLYSGSFSRAGYRALISNGSAVMEIRKTFFSFAMSLLFRDSVAGYHFIVRGDGRKRREESMFGYTVKTRGVWGVNTPPPCPFFLIIDITTTRYSYGMVLLDNCTSAQSPTYPSLLSLFLLLLLLLICHIFAVTSLRDRIQTRRCHASPPGSAGHSVCRPSSRANTRPDLRPCRAS